MCRLSRFFILFLIYYEISGDSFSVKISTEHYVNVVDKRFLSFTVDPKYLFSSSEKYDNQACLCMASALTPAYIRIAGPSTSKLSFDNSTLSLNQTHEENSEKRQRKFKLTDLVPQKDETVSVTNEKWTKFLQWTKSVGFDLVFAVNNEEQTAAGLWDPNPTLDMLTVAEKENVGHMFWELGYECRNQSIEEYLNDLETLRLLVESFPSGEQKEWKVIGGDVSGCLQADSKSDFKDYVTLSNDMMDAILLDGNSSSRELERMSESARLSLLRALSHSQTPLWITEATNKRYNELERAADWMTSLGYSARNGFSVHYRELLEEELYEPTLSFYMALLYKNLVGERVLNVDMTAERAAVFAHCATLRHEPAPGAVSVYGVNMDDEPARFSVKLGKREDGGDIMQFILGVDLNGNIVVNGHAMYYEGDIRPVVKRVRPYKTLLLTLPAKSFGFWVLANTKVEACYDFEENNLPPILVEAETVPEVTVESPEHENTRRKRSLESNDISIDYPDFPDIDEEYYKIENTKGNSNSKPKIDILNYNSIEDKAKKYVNKKFIEHRYKREVFDDEQNDNKMIRKNRKGLKSRYGGKISMYADKIKSDLLEKLNYFKNNKLRQPLKYLKNRINKRDSINTKTEAKFPIIESEENEHKRRVRRSIIQDNETSASKGDVLKKNDEDNERNALKFILKRLQNKYGNIPIEELNNEYSDEVDKYKNDDNGIEDELVLKTKITDSDTIIDVSEKSNHGFLKSTFGNMFSVFEDLNNNLNKFIKALSIFE